MRYLQIVHVLRGRTRLRCPSLRKELDLVECVADALAALPGVHDVAVRPFTGSILVTHDPGVNAEQLADVAKGALGLELVLRRGERPPIDPNEIPELSKIAKLTVEAVREIDRDVRRVSDGSLDLGTVATLGFFGAGALQLAFEEEVETPQWFNLAWWGYRTFMTNETDAIEAVHNGSS